MIVKRQILRTEVNNYEPSFLMHILVFCVMCLVLQLRDSVWIQFRAIGLFIADQVWEIFNLWIFFELADASGDHR